MQTRLRKTGLTASIAIITLAVILAIGSTFSLFTSNDGNDITVDSATVKVASAIKNVETFSLGVATNDGKFANLGTALSNSANDAVTITNMTPGDEAKVTIGITNESTVLIAYRLKVTVTYTGTAVDEEPKITDVIKVTAKQGETLVPMNDGYTDWAYTTQYTDGTINNTIDDITVSILLPVEAGNDYQNDSMKVRFAIEAVQANAAQLVKVTTADELYAALETNGEAILLGNITLTDDIIVKGNATIDLNGYALTGNIINNGNLIIKDSMGAVTADASGETTESPSGKFFGSITNKGALTITGGSFENTGAAVIENVAAATLVIEGGSFTSTIEDFAISYESTENITISGGEFSGKIADEKLDELVGEGMSTKKDENGNIVFVPVAIIEVEDVVDLFEKLASVDSSSVIIEMAESLSTQDDQITETIIIDKEVVLNPNGMYLVSNAPATFTVVEGGKLTISEGSFTVKNTATNGACVIVDGGEFVMEGGSFDGHTAVRTTEGESSTVTLAAGWSNRVTVGFELNGNDTLNVTGGTLISSKQSVISNGDLTFNMSGGTLSGKSPYTYNSSIVCNGKTVINMTGGKAEATSGETGVFTVYNDSVINISGDAVVSGTFCAVNAGGLMSPKGNNNKINISGDATLKASGGGNAFGIGYALFANSTNTDVTVSGNAQITGTSYGVYAGHEGSSITVSDNAVIKAPGSRASGYGVGAPEITITGGTIEAKEYGALSIAGGVLTIDNSTSGNAITIKGGISSLNVPDGATLIINGNPVIE